MKPLYIWAGGKNRMIPKYCQNPGIPYSGYDTFVEPMFGGGAMTIHIAENNLNVKRFIINDIKAEITGLYNAIKKDVKGFMKQCDKYSTKYLAMNKENRKDFYYKVRKEYMIDYDKWSPIEEAGTLYFLMRTSFNGIFQSTKESKGRFATPAGLLDHKNRVYDKTNVLEWSRFLQKVDICSGDWKDCVSNINGRTFYFFDPPYRNSFTQYGESFTDDKQIEVINFAKQAKSAGHIVMFCGREAGDSFYLDHKGDLNIRYYDAKYTAGVRATNNDGSRSAKRATEILLYSM